MVPSRSTKKSRWNQHRAASVRNGLKPRRTGFETLESRQLLTVTLNDLGTVTLHAGAPLMVALNGGGATDLTFSASPVDGSLITAAQTPSTNPTMQVNVRNLGAMTFQLFQNYTPATVAHIESLISNKFYNTLDYASGKDPMTFHRVDSSVGVVQGGDPDAKSTSSTALHGSGVTVNDEYNMNLRYTAGSGVLGMAKAQDNGNDSQFFITYPPVASGTSTAFDQRHWDFRYTIFGFQTTGQTVLQQIEGVSLTSGTTVPATDVIIDSVKIITDHQNAVLMLNTKAGVTSGETDVTVVVSDGQSGAGHTVTKTLHVKVVADNPYLMPIPIVTDTSSTFGVSRITMTAGTSVDYSFTAQTTTVGSTQVYFDSVINPSSQGVSVTVADHSTGAIKVTATNKQAGIYNLLVGVIKPGTSGGEWDTRNVPIIINPATPTAVKLQPGSDTGSSPTDGITTISNGLQFQVSGTFKGATVTLFADGTKIGEAVAAGDTTIVTTTTALQRGKHTITTQQTLKGQTLNVGNQKGTLDLASGVTPANYYVSVENEGFTVTSSPSLAATVGQLYSYNVQTNASSGHTVLYKLLSAPPNMSMDSEGRVRWTPTSAQWPVQAITLQVSDTAGNVAKQAFNIQVTDPAIAGYDPNPVVQVSDAASYVLQRDGTGLKLLEGSLTLLSQPLAATHSVTVVGAAGKAASLTIDMVAGGSFSLSGGVTFTPGSGVATDSLAIRGTAGGDTILLKGQSLTLNGVATKFTGVNQIRLDGGAGNDNYVLWNSPADVALVDAAGNADCFDFGGGSAGINFNMNLTAGQKQWIAPWKHYLSVQGGAENLVGTNFADTLLGNAADNVIHGGPGNDIIHGGGGNDVIYGDAGNNDLWADNGSAALLGGSGSSILHGGPGHNLLIAGSGASTLYGGSGENLMVGGSTSYDANDKALLAILAEGVSYKTYVMTRRTTAGSSQNVGNFLGAGANPLCRGTTVCDYGKKNVLVGGSGHNWFVPGANDVCQNL